MAKTFDINHPPKFPWIDDESTFEKFYLFEKRIGAIESNMDLNNFAKRFTISDEPFDGPLIWARTVVLLSYTYYELEASGIMSPVSELPELIRAHFIRKNGKKFNSDSIRNLVTYTAGISIKVDKTIDNMFQMLNRPRVPRHELKLNFNTKS